METLLGTFLQELSARVGGPGRLRFVIQPVVATILGVRDGINDAHAGRPAYFIGVFLSHEYRRDMLRTSVADAGVPFGVGVVMDVILQWFIFGSVRLIPAIFVGVLLIGLPYSISRGLANRVTRHRMARRQRSGEQHPGD